MVRYLLDTDICISLLQHKPLSITRHLEGLTEGDVVISSITLAELEHGVGRDPLLSAPRRKALNEMLEYIPVLTFDRKAAETYGKLRCNNTHLGRHRFDTLIAAHAMTAHAVLVTNNTKDFKGIKGLEIVNWMAD